MHPKRTTKKDPRNWFKDIGLNHKDLFFERNRVTVNKNLLDVMSPCTNRLVSWVGEAYFAN